MKNPPLFSVVPLSMTGFSLLQWTIPSEKGPSALRSIQVETDIAEHLAHAANSRPELLAALAFYADRDNWREQVTGIGCFPGSIHDDQGDKARAVLWAQKS